MNFDFKKENLLLVHPLEFFLIRCTHSLEKDYLLFQIEHPGRSLWPRTKQKEISGQIFTKHCLWKLNWIQRVISFWEYLDKKGWKS